MKYFIIAGEASGDLHAAHLIRALSAEDPQAAFQCYGGDEMQAAGATLLRHYRDLAYMGFLPVLRHLPDILRGMRACKAAIEAFKPDAVILVDYPGFNLKIARYVSTKGLCPVFYYISPKIWAWKSWRIRQIRRYVTRLYSILPFEPAWFARRGYEIEYVGNPTLDEVTAYKTAHPTQKATDRPLLALLPGSRRQEVTDNLQRMLQAVSLLKTTDNRPLQPVVAMAPALPRSLYEDIARRTGVKVELEAGKTYDILAQATAALVTSGTATLETALFNVPQVVCYYVSFGRFIRLMKHLVLSVKHVSLVNLIVGREAVPELIGDQMSPQRVAQELARILPDGEGRQAQLQAYAELQEKLGQPGAPQHTAKDIIKELRG